MIVSMDSDLGDNGYVGCIFRGHLSHDEAQLIQTADPLFLAHDSGRLQTLSLTISNKLPCQMLAIEVASEGRWQSGD